MDDLISFIRKDNPHKYDLLKIAIAHHRLVWIHPFENGNGRVVRLFTYALLLKYVFKSKKRIINPTAVFCSDRQAYYDNLSKADMDGESGMIAWAEYMLKGLKTEIVKIDRLNDAAILVGTILVPALEDARDRKLITPEEFCCLKTGVETKEQTFQSSDLVKVLPGKSPSDRSRIIRKLVNNRLASPISKGSRRYYVRFTNNFLMRSILKVLDDRGFLPDNNALGITTQTVVN